MENPFCHEYWSEFEVQSEDWWKVFSIHQLFKKNTNEKNNEKHHNLKMKNRIQNKIRNENENEFRNEIRNEK